MNLNHALDRCFSFINLQIQPPSNPLVPYVPELRRAVTISRETGSGAHAVAEKLAEFLEKRLAVPGRPWTVFDRNLVEKVLEDNRLPGRLARFMQEDRISEISDTMDELFGLHPSSFTLAHKIAESILHLAELGNVILIGRGANIITSRMEHVFHVRLTGSVERRTQHLQEYYQMDARKALEFLQEQDLGRKRYLKKHFEREIGDPLLYHLQINTDLVPYEEAARIIGEAVLNMKPATAPLMSKPQAAPA